MSWSRACRPPNLIQICTVCSPCPSGHFIKQACSANSDTVCKACSSSVCVSDEYNAQFGSPNGCTGTEYHDTVQCGVATEAYGQPCSNNFFKKQSRIFLPASLPTLAGQGAYAAFDVSPDRAVYAIGHGSTISVFDYVAGNATVLQTAVLPVATLTLTDIRFSSDGVSILATVRQTDAIYRCNVRCPLGVYVPDQQDRLVCSSPHAERQWSSRNAPGPVKCVLWMQDAVAYPAAGRSFQVCTSFPFCMAVIRTAA